MQALTLIVVGDDVAGSMNALARDLRMRGQKVRVLSLDPRSEFGFPVDLYQNVDGGRELLSIAGQATRLHLVDTSFDHLGPWASPLKARAQVGQLELSLQFDGALNSTMIRQELDAWGSTPRLRICTRPGLAKAFGLDFLPPYLPIGRAKYRPVQPGTRMRAPKTRKARFYFAGRHPLQHYSGLESLMDRWEAREDKDLELQTAKAHGDVLTRRRRAHLSAGTGRGYFSRSTLEALAAGLRVVCPHLGDWQDAYSALAQGRKAPVLSLDDFERALEEVTPLSEPLAEARAWACQVLDPHRWISRFERVGDDKARVA